MLHVAHAELATKKQVEYPQAGYIRRPLNVFSSSLMDAALAAVPSSFRAGGWLFRLFKYKHIRMPVSPAVTRVTCGIRPSAVYVPAHH